MNIHLFNTPIQVSCSQMAIEKITSDTHTLDIYAVSQEGRKAHIVSITDGFFGRVQRDQKTEKSWIDYQVRPFPPKWTQPFLSLERFINTTKPPPFNFNSLEVHFVIGNKVEAIARGFFDPQNGVRIKIDFDETNHWQITLSI